MEREGSDKKGRRRCDSRCWCLPQQTWYDGPVTIGSDMAQQTDKDQDGILDAAEPSTGTVARWMGTLFDRLIDPQNCWAWTSSLCRVLSSSLRVLSHAASPSLRPRPGSPITSQQPTPQQRRAQSHSPASAGQACSCVAAASRRSRRACRLEARRSVPAGFEREPLFRAGACTSRILFTYSSSSSAATPLWDSGQTFFGHHPGHLARPPASPRIARQRQRGEPAPELGSCFLVWGRCGHPAPGTSASCTLCSGDRGLPHWPSISIPRTACRRGLAELVSSSSGGGVAVELVSGAAELVGRPAWTRRVRRADDKCLRRTTCQARNLPNGQTTTTTPAVLGHAPAFPPPCVQGMLRPPWGRSFVSAFLFDAIRVAVDARQPAGPSQPPGCPPATSMQPLWRQASRTGRAVNKATSRHSYASHLAIFAHHRRLPRLSLPDSVFQLVPAWRSFFSFPFSQASSSCRLPPLPSTSFISPLPSHSITAPRRPLAIHDTSRPSQTPSARYDQRLPPPPTERKSARREDNRTRQEAPVLATPAWLDSGMMNRPCTSRDGGLISLSSMHISQHTTSTSNTWIGVVFSAEPDCVQVLGCTVGCRQPTQLFRHHAGNQNQRVNSN